jgi:hypothetical protein
MTEDDQVQTARSRWAFTNDLLAAGIVLAVYALRAATVRYGVDPGPLPWVTDVVLPGLAGAWLFGRGAVGSLQQLRG